VDYAADKNSNRFIFRQKQMIRAKVLAVNFHLPVKMHYS